MTIVVTKSRDEETLQEILEYLGSLGVEYHISRGEEKIIIGIIGSQEMKSALNLSSLAGVERIIPIVTPYKLASRAFHPEDTIISLTEDITIGGQDLQVMAGPCAIESLEQTLEIAGFCREGGARIFRGGAFKPRTSPYSFCGLGEDGLKYMAAAREKTGMPIISEIMDTRDLDMMCQYVDVLQIGTRNMQNFALLREVGKTKVPVLLKRGLSSTIEEWIMAAEYILAGGNPNVMFCERGIRTFETHTRNTLDLSAVPILKELTHLPVIVDPSHGTGKWHLVEPMAKAAIAAGADGLMIEVHQDPLKAMSDGDQSLKPATFKKLMGDLSMIATAVGRKL